VQLTEVTGVYTQAPVFLSQESVVQSSLSLQTVFERKQIGFPLTSKEHFAVSHLSAGVQSVHPVVHPVRSEMVQVLVASLQTAVLQMEASFNEVAHSVQSEVD
jgi:hypothetical protein